MESGAYLLMMNFPTFTVNPLSLNFNLVDLHTVFTMFHCIKTGEHLISLKKRKQIRAFAGGPKPYMFSYLIA